MRVDGHDHTLSVPAPDVTRDLHAGHSLPIVAAVDALTAGNPADCPPAGQGPSAHLRALLADAERDLARHSHAARLTAAVVSRRDWRDRLLADVLRGQESP